MPASHDERSATPAESPREPQMGWHFAVPMLRWCAPDAAALNEALAALILARRAAGPEAHLSNVGGWQSHPDQTIF